MTTSVTEPADGGEGTALTRLGTHAVKGAALLGGLVYAMTILGYQGFYSSLDVRPEEVGLDHTTVLIRAVIGLVDLSSFFGAFVLLVGLPTRWARTWLRTRRANRHLDRIDDSAMTLGVVPTSADLEWLYAASVLPVWTLWFGFESSSIPGGDNTIWFLVALAWAGWFFAWWRFHRVRHNKTVHYRIALAAAVLLGVFAVLESSDSVGISLAWYVQNNGQLPDYFANTDVASIYVQASCVAAQPTAGLPKSVSLPGHLVYLGTGAGTTILYDPSQQGRTLRLPSSSLVLTDEMNPAACRPTP